MQLTYQHNNEFSSVLNHVRNTFHQVHCSGASVFIIHNDSVVLEEYIGKQSNDSGASIVNKETQFHVASVRKSYIGFAVAYALYHNYIGDIDDLVLNYLPELDEIIWKKTTIRHLLTHTHGLYLEQGIVYREHPAGQSWTYRQVGIDALTKIVKKTTNKSVSEIIHEHVFSPLGFSESNWYAHKDDNLVDVILPEAGDENWQPSESTEGDKANMYVSTRELAYWGYFHLNQGKI
ncbi:serine hydrolase domain-containing protein [Metabacillus litoralis]|uniref:serine hydrolase domain-containing protein n=1 Tax=Metabacillus litoralis TaxID=152268 RepID=UPI001F02AF34|nr:serine hydrolase domain-containing protein [Metabacillus litoralis]